MNLVAFLIVIFGVFSRLLPHHPNFSPVAAIALFGGATLPKKFIFLPLLILFVSDFFLGFYGTDMLYVYGSFALIGLIGLWLRNHRKTKYILGSSLLSSILFYLITNFGVWAWPNNWYPHNLSGLMQSYIMALPFFRNTLLGDLAYTVIIFGGFKLLKVLGRKYFSRKLFRVVFN